MISENVVSLNKQVRAEVEKTHTETPLIVYVSKFHTAKEIKEAYDAGARHFGESRVQEFVQKKSECPADIVWHFVGPLQRNKVKQLVGEVELIHSVDSVKLANEINRIAEAKSIVQNCLIEVNVSGESTKGGFTVEELKQEVAVLKEFQSIGWLGLMTIAAHTEDEAVIQKNFQALKAVLEEIKGLFPLGVFKELSMGMTNDWKLAVEEGATMLRIGTLIFGERKT